MWSEVYLALLNPTSSFRTADTAFSVHSPTPISSLSPIPSVPSLIDLSVSQADCKAVSNVYPLCSYACVVPYVDLPALSRKLQSKFAADQHTTSQSLLPCATPTCQLPLSPQAESILAKLHSALSRLNE